MDKTTIEIYSIEFNFLWKTLRNTYVNIYNIESELAKEKWGKMLDDEVIATALLDRLLYHCEVVKLSGKSYRLKNRKSIF